MNTESMQIIIGIGQILAVAIITYYRVVVRY